MNVYILEIYIYLIHGILSATLSFMEFLDDCCFAKNSMKPMGADNIP